MWIIHYAIGVLFGSILILIMVSFWGLSWKQVGVYLLLSGISEIFFRTSRDIRRENAEAEQGHIKTY